MKKREKLVIPTKYILSFLSVVCALFMILCLVNENVARPIKNACAAVVIPVQKGMNYVGTWFYDKSEMLKDLSDLQAENERLKAENAELKADNIILSQQQSELDRLRELYASITNKNFICFDRKILNNIGYKLFICT